MKKQIIRLTESDLHKIIENSVNKIIKEGSCNEMPDNDYSNNAYKFDRSADIQNIKAELGDVIENKIAEYHLTKDEVIRILDTMMKYFNNYEY